MNGLRSGIDLKILCFFAAVAMSANAEVKTIKGGWYKPLFGQGKSVQVSDFQIDETPVTNADFERFIGARPQWRRDRISRLFADDKYLAHWKSAQRTGDSNLNSSPVTNVSWFSANAYCRWRDMRLPKVHEWEYLAQHGPIDNPKDVKSVILEWYSQPAPSKLPSVKSTFRNKFDVWDIHGLIWEWTYDFNTTLVTGESRGDVALEKSMYCGAGAVGVADPANYAAFMRFGFRSSLQGNYSVGNLGFRCASEVKK